MRRRREALIERDRALGSFVVDRLAEGWSPEQISGWLKGGTRVVTNAAVRADQDLRKIPSRIASPSTNGPRMSPPETEGGHWEGDLIICKRTRPVLVLHERKSRATLATRLGRKNRRRDHFGHAGGVRSDRTGAAQVHHFRQ